MWRLSKLVPGIEVARAARVIAAVPVALVGTVLLCRRRSFLQSRQDDRQPDAARAGIHARQFRDLPGDAQSDVSRPRADPARLDDLPGRALGARGRRRIRAVHRLLPDPAGGARAHDAVRPALRTRMRRWVRPAAAEARIVRARRRGGVAPPRRCKPAASPGAAAPGRMGVNARNFDPRDIESARIRRFDGATTWKFLD